MNSVRNKIYHKITQNITSILWAFLLNVLWFGVDCHKDSQQLQKMMPKLTPINDATEKDISRFLWARWQDSRVPSFCLKAEARGLHSHQASLWVSLYPQGGSHRKDFRKSCCEITCPFSFTMKVATMPKETILKPDT